MSTNIAVFKHIEKDIEVIFLSDTNDDSWVRISDPVEVGFQLDYDSDVINELLDNMTTITLIKQEKYNDPM